MKILKTRRDRLLAELARGFRHGACLLLDRDWLVKHNVTLTEAHDLGDAIANAITMTINVRDFARNKGVR